MLFAVIMAAGTASSFPDGLGTRNPQPVVMHPDTGSDSWGYTWFRSDEPGGPTFNWVDITTRGTLVSGLGDDNYVGPFPMQFTFRYYWYPVSSFYIGSNGYINLTSPANFGTPFSRLPSTSAVVPKDLFAACVGDLDFNISASNPKCYYWTNGVDSLVVSFINVTEWQQVPNPNLKHTFQIILNKRDSSITYQYGMQQGRYNSPNNNYLCIGWQNYTGQIGHSYTYSTTPPHALMPDSGLAIKIRRVFPGFIVPDAGIVGGFDTENLAKIMRVGVADTVKCVVKNFGTSTITNAPVRYAITRTGQPSVFDTVIVPSLASGQQTTVTFPRLFTPAVAGTYSALFNVTIPNDWGPGNDNKTAEIFSASFGVGQSTLIWYENGLPHGSVWWPSGEGFGVSIDLPPQVYPVRVETVYVQIGSIITQPLTVEILDGSSGSPGAVLATRTVNATAMARNVIVFTADNIVINGGRFFVGALGNMEFQYEVTAPISYRGWEYTNTYGWVPSNSRDIRDFIIRASVRGVTTDVNEVSGAMPYAFDLLQNYPNPFNPTTNIEYRIANREFVSLKVFDVLGREVATLVDEVKQPGNYSITFDAPHLSSGIYVYQLSAGSQMQSRKMMLVR